MKPQVLLDLQNITLRLGSRAFLENSSWRIRKGQQWAVLGPNGSGKSTLVKAILGSVPIIKGKVQSLERGKIGYVSFESHINIAEQEEFNDTVRYFSGNMYETTMAIDIILSAASDKDKASEDLERITRLLSIGRFIDHSVSSLSTGEMRKIIFARALIKDPTLLILDEPFDGLDKDSRNEYGKIINNLMKSGLQVIIVVHRVEEIPPGITHVLCLKNGKIYASGLKQEIINSKTLSDLYNHSIILKKTNGVYGVDCNGYIDDKKAIKNNKDPQKAKEISSIIIDMRNVSVRYGDVVALDNISWKAKKGENWAILGLNGAGKSTLLKLITGENLQTYSNDITLFGRKRNDGFSLWELKSLVGVVSADTHISFRKSLSALEVVLSGFFDSIGLYRKPNKSQIVSAENLVKKLKVGHLMERTFMSLSNGEKRMVLIARALVKKPQLLILDEPCHGLDFANRDRVINMIGDICKNLQTQVIYTTHHEEEIPAQIKHVLRLSKGRIIKN